MTIRDERLEAPKVSEKIYEQWCEDFRNINNIFWRVPFIAMTLTGGIVFGIGTIHFSPVVQTALLLFLALCNLCFIVIVWRLRVGVMEPMLRNIYRYEGRTKPPISYGVVITFTVLFGITTFGAGYGAVNRDLLFSPDAARATAPDAAGSTKDTKASPSETQQMTPDTKPAGAP
jgi:hypothetical protein